MADNLHEEIEMERMKVDKKNIDIMKEYKDFCYRLSQMKNRPLPKVLNRQPLPNTIVKQAAPWQMTMDGHEAHLASEEGRAKAAFDAAEKKIHKTKAQLDRQFDAWPEAVKKEGKQIL